MGSKEPKSRLAIASELGVSDEQFAVLVKAGKVAAIVVRKDGHHPSGEVFPNTLTASEFRMFGRNNPHGRLLENKDVTVPLYFSHNNDGQFTEPLAKPVQIVGVLGVRAAANANRNAASVANGRGARSVA